MSGRLNIGFLRNDTSGACRTAILSPDLCSALEDTGSINSIFVSAGRGAPGRFGAMKKHAPDLIVLEYDGDGDPDDERLKAFIDTLKCPVITVFGNLRQEPGESPHPMIRDLASRSVRVVALSGSARKILQTFYKTPPKKIDTIPYIMAPPPTDGIKDAKWQLGYEGRKVLSTIGPLDPSSGLTDAVEAMANLVAKDSTLIYLILDQTRPCQRHESYKNKLCNLIALLDLENHVQIIDAASFADEVGPFIDRTDIYISPVVCGSLSDNAALASAVRGGKAIVSTPYLYAKELFHGNRGNLANFCDAASIARRVSDLLHDPAGKAELEARVLALGASMDRTTIAQKYIRLFANVLSDGGVYRKAI